MTKTEADNIISKYYPNNLTIDELESKYTHTKEFKNLEKICKEAESQLPIWDKVIEDIKDNLPSTYFVQDWTHLFRNDPSFRLRISYPKLDRIPQRFRELMLNVSVLTDYYCIYISEKDFNPATKKYTLPVIAIKNSYNDDYLKMKPLSASIDERVSKHFIDNTTHEFIYENIESEKLIFTSIEKALSKYLPKYKRFSYSFILDRADNFTNANKIGGEMTYFDCLFSDHIF